jgi:dTDP-D-glucose 4,6-dehydratase
MSAPAPYGIYFIKNPQNNSPNMILYISNSLLIRKNKNPMKETHPVLSKHDYFVIVYDVNGDDTRYVLDYNTLAKTMIKALDTEEYNQYQLNDYFGYEYGIDFFDQRIQFAKNLIQKTI